VNNDVTLDNQSGRIHVKFIGPKGGIGPAEIARYMEERRTHEAANGTINRELAVLGRMLRLAYENGKLVRMPVIRKLSEGISTAGLLRTGAV